MPAAKAKALRSISELPRHRRFLNAMLLGVFASSSALAAVPFSTKRWRAVRPARHFVKVADFSPSFFLKIPKNYAGIDSLPAPWPKLASLNRYVDILPNPHSRVPLETGQGGPVAAYMNANFVRGFDGSPRAYIATQGPVRATLGDFWRMVWERDARVIVMLTGLEENGIRKCERYWPNAAGQQSAAVYGDFEISTASIERTGAYVHSVLKLLRHGDAADLDDRIVHHFWYNTWPDHGAPDEVHGVIAMWREVCELCEDGPSERQPWVVHCSAGIGRTGTFVAVDKGARQLWSTGRADVVELIGSMREDRGGMVQTTVQAHFAYQALFRIAADLNNELVRSSVSVR